MSIVLDASVSLAWCFKNELTEAASQVLERLQSDTAYVPSLWPLEVANTLNLAERRGRLTVSETASLILMLNSLGVVIDPETSSFAFTQILYLARTQRLTTYDAAYLELAMRMGIPLATKDDALGDAAERVGVTLLRVT